MAAARRGAELAPAGADASAVLLLIRSDTGFVAAALDALEPPDDETARLLDEVRSELQPLHHTTGAGTA